MQSTVCSERTQLTRETDFTETAESSGHCVPHINIGLPDESCYPTYKNEYSLLNNTHNFCA
jgi:hypothetical protein